MTINLLRGNVIRVTCVIQIEEVRKLSEPLEEVLGKIRNSVHDGDEESVKKYCDEALKKGASPTQVMEALAEGVKEVGEEWVRGDVFMVHVLLAANAMKAGMEVVKPLLVGKEERKPLGKVVIGTVEGDIHDLGKNMVAAMLMAEGFEVVDLGVDVPAEKFVEVVREVSPDIVGLSALMSVSMEGQRKTVEALKEAGLKDRVKVIVGGAPVTAEWAEEIGADGYAEDAFEATKVAKKLIGR